LGLAIREQDEQDEDNEEDDDEGYSE